MRGGVAGILELVQDAELFLEQVGAVQRSVGGLDLGERGALAGGELLGCFVQRPAGVLDPDLTDLHVGAHGVGVLPADLVDRGAGQSDTWKGSNAISACGSQRRIVPA